MSAQTIMEAFIPVEIEYRAQIARATWGHLAPIRNKRYRGTILFAHGDYGDIVPLKCELAGLDDSPWYFDAMQDFIGEQAAEPGIYRFTGYFCNYRFVGRVERLEV